MRVPSRPAFLAELDPLAWWLVVLLGIEVLLGPVNAVVDFARMRGTDLTMTVDIRPGAPPPNVETFRSLSAGPLALPAGLLSVTLIVLWLVWQHRATSRLWAYGVPGLRVTPGWAVGWWFIPLASLVMPFVAMRELDARSADGRARPALLWAWWLCYMVAPLVVASVAIGSTFRGIVAAANTNQQVVTMDFGPFLRWIPVSGLFTGAAAALACAIVLGIERAQARLVPTIAAPDRPDAVVPGVGRAPAAAAVRTVGRPGGEVPPTGLGWAVIALLAAQFVLADLGVLAFLVHMTLYRRVEAGGAVSGQDLSRANGFVATVPGIWTLLFLVTVVVWCVWQHHAQRTLVRLTHGAARFTPGWAVGWWFVPFANLVLPFRTVHELWWSSRAAAGASARSQAWLVPAWWVTWVGWWALSIVGSSASGSWHAVVVDDAWTAVAYALLAASSALAIAIVASVRRTQGPAAAALTTPRAPLDGLDAFPPRPD